MTVRDRARLGLRWLASPAVDEVPRGHALAAAALRVLLGLMWLHNLAWKRPPDFGQNAGALATEPGGQWYRTLKKPSWQPPAAAFPIVWTSLYALIAATSAAALNELDRRGDQEQAAQYRRALGRNLALNGFWSWLFFRWHNLPAATAGAGVLAANTIALARRADRIEPRYGRWLAPYAAWTSFATVLAGVVWWHNRPRA